MVAIVPTLNFETANSVEEFGVNLNIYLYCDEKHEQYCEKIIKRELNIKNPKFKKNPLVIDIFSQKNNIPKYSSVLY